MLSGIVREMDAIYDLSGFTAILDIILSLATVQIHVHVNLLKEKKAKVLTNAFLSDFFFVR